MSGQQRAYERHDKKDPEPDVAKIYFYLKIFMKNEWIIHNLTYNKSNEDSRQL